MAPWLRLGTLSLCCSWKSIPSWKWCSPLSNSHYARFLFTAWAQLVLLILGLQVKRVVRLFYLLQYFLYIFTHPSTSSKLEIDSKSLKISNSCHRDYDLLVYPCAQLSRQNILYNSACNNPLPSPLACEWFRVDIVFRSGRRMNKYKHM